MSEIGNALAVAASSGDPNTVPACITRAARTLCELSTEGAPLVGYIALGVYADGGFSMGFQTPDNHPIIGRTLFAAYVREIIRRELTGKQAADDYAKEWLL